MGKRRHQSDKLYLSAKEWTHIYGGKIAGQTGPEFKRLPWNCCCISFNPVSSPMCDRQGNIYDLVNIVPYLKKYGTSPVTGEKMKYKDLIKLNIFKNASGEYHDPVTYKHLTDNSKIVAIATTGNVFLYDSIDRLNIKPKNWKDLITDEPFARADILVLQDPQAPEKQNFAAFHHVQHRLKVVTEEDRRMLSDPAYNIRSAPAEAQSALTDYYKKEKAMDAELQAAQALRAEAEADIDDELVDKTVSDNRVAMSFTSTAAAPQTKNLGAVLDRDYVRYRKVKKKGYARISTNKGDINIELHCNVAPRTCENFILLAERGYYNGTKFHRLIKNFMIQGGDPTGTGTGGESAWGAPFEDEWKLELTHEGRGILSMANKGPNTNTSQFFITFRSCKHLDKKHTIFGRVVGGLDTLTEMERVKTDDDDVPREDIVINKVTVFVNPFAEVDAQKAEEDKARREAQAKEKAQAAATAAAAKPASAGEVKPVKAGVGKYIGAAPAPHDKRALPDDTHDIPEPKRKKPPSAGFGDFSSW